MLLSEIRFGSYLSPRGQSQEAAVSRKVRDALKLDRVILDPPRPTSVVLSERLAAVIAQTALGSILGPDAVLVPAPKSGLLVRGGLWVPERIASALVAVGLGREVFRCLERTEPVRKAAFSEARERPRASDHYRTLSVRGVASRPDKIVIVDDFVTRGATLLGAASRIAETWDGAAIAGFAMIRTVSNPDEFERIDESVLGTITLRGDETRRRP